MIKNQQALINAAKKLEGQAARYAGYLHDGREAFSNAMLMDMREQWEIIEQLEDENANNRD